MCALLCVLACDPWDPWVADCIARVFPARVTGSSASIALQHPNPNLTTIHTHDGMLTQTHTNTHACTVQYITVE